MNPGPVFGNSELRCAAPGARENKLSPEGSFGFNFLKQ
jgi:hypothetical protein